MPDLTRPVDAVSKAVANLVKVGRETINSSDDQILRQEMPGSLQRVNGASKLLEEACAMLKADPYSQPARKKLIEGARGKRIQDTHTLTHIPTHQQHQHSCHRTQSEQIQAKHIHSNAFCQWHKCFLSHLI